jgi:hypothetical protein
MVNTDVYLEFCNIRPDEELLVMLAKVLFIGSVYSVFWCIDFITKPLRQYQMKGPVFCA